MSEKNTELVKATWQTMKWEEGEKLNNLARFNELIDRPPNPRHVDTNQYSQGAKYLPIRVVESTLRIIFPAHQIVSLSDPLVIGNSVVMRARIKVLHPVMMEWFEYDGVGAVPIEVKKGHSPLDFDNINPKALHKNVPAAYSFAVSNAAKKIGRVFGSHLNTAENQVVPVANMYQQTPEK